VSRAPAKRLGWFAAAAGAVVVASLGARFCPGSCAGCGSCVASYVPLFGSIGVVGSAAIASTRRSQKAKTAQAKREQ